MPSYTCLNCHKDSQHVCGCCKNSFYCSEDCRKDDWTKRHKYESFLFKARDPIELDGDDSEKEREREKRVKIEKVRTEGELLREQYQEASRLLQKAREEKPRTKREMSMTHTERKRYEFALIVALKKMTSENQDDQTREEEFIRGMEDLVNDMNVVPLRNGQQREIVLGPIERVEIGHMLMRRRILYLKLALLTVTKSQAVSRETTAFRQMMDDKERRFSFNLFVRESDNITYEEVIAKKHKEIEKDIIDSWIENAYVESMLGAKEETIKFIDTYRNDPGRNADPVDEEQREKEWNYVKTRMIVAKDCTLQFALCTRKNSLSKGLITEEVYLNSTRHYQELSDRIDRVLEEDKEKIVEDMERMLRRYYGKEWKEVEAFLSGSVAGEKEEKGFPLGIITMLSNPSWKKAGWIFLTMFALYFISAGLMYIFGLTGLLLGGASDLDAVKEKGQEVAVGLAKMKQPLKDLTQDIGEINTEIVEIQNRMMKVNMTQFHTHVEHGVNATTDLSALDTINFTLDRVFKSVRTLFDETLNSELGKAGREKAGLKSLKELNSYLRSYERTPVKDYATRSSILDDISSKLKTDSRLSTMIGSSQSNNILLSILKQIKNLVLGLNKTTDQLNDDLESVTRLSDELNKSMTLFDQNYRDKVRSPVIIPSIFGSCTYGYNTQERIIEIYTNGSKLEKFLYSIGDPFVGTKNTLIAAESYLLQAVDRIPSGIGPQWIVHIVKSVFSVNFLHAQMLLYSVLTDGGFTFYALAIPFVINKIANKVGLGNVKQVVMNKASALMKKILLSCCRCCGTAKEDTIILDAITNNNINSARNEMSALRRKGKGSFYDFYDLTIKYNLSGHALHAFWHNVSSLDGWNTHEIRLSQLNYYFQNLYYHGVVNWSYIFTGITFYYQAKMIVDVWGYAAQTLWSLIVYPFSFIPGAEMLIGFVGNFFVFLLISVFIRLYFSLERNNAIKRHNVVEKWTSDNPVLEAEDSDIIKSDFKWFFKPELSILEKIPTDPQKYRDLVYWLKDFGYSALSYINVIGFVLYWILLTATMMSKVSDFLGVGKQISTLKSVFFSGAEVTENMKLGLKIKEDYEKNITAFENLASGTNETIEAVKEYTNKTSFNSAEIVLNDFYANLYASNKLLDSVVTKITKTKPKS